MQNGNTAGKANLPPPAERAGGRRISKGNASNPLSKANENTTPPPEEGKHSTVVSFMAPAK